MGKQTKERERELARFYFMQGMEQKEIAERVGVSPVTVNRWAKNDNWALKRAATTISRKEIVVKMLMDLNEKLDNNEITPDEMAKVTASIERIDKQTNVVTVIDVFTSYNRWLISRMNLDQDLTPELLQVMNKYQDLFINEKLNTTNLDNLI